MTATTETTGPAVNGAAPAAAGDGGDPGDLVPVSERVMGIIGILFAVGILAIAVDLATGGALSDLFAGGGDGND